MTDAAPTKIAIDHDDYHARYVGRTGDGRQFFLTTPFEPARGGRLGAEYLALFLFDAAGRLIEAKIDDLGPRATTHAAAEAATRERWLRELGDVTYERIEVGPFSVERFGTEFGLIPRPPEESDDGWWVELLPGNFMAFHEPWDSGEYDT